jgi:hypothetical protein
MARQYTRRQPVTDNPALQNKNIRPSLARQMRLDSSVYEEIHKGKKLMKIPDTSVEFHWWLQNGAEPVPRATEKTKIFKGLNDKFDSEWVTWPSGTKKDGSVELTYLLMVDPATYDELITVPLERRQAEIEQAMRLGRDQSGLEAHLPGGGGIQTYAPNLPTGTGQGLSESQSFNSIR